MTLKEKILSDNYLEDYNTPITDYQADCIVERADDYAIEFAEWLQSSCYSLIEGKYVFRNNTFKTKELLEIFKKEKGL